MNLDDHASLAVIPELTPNPSSVKFNVNRTLVEGVGYDFQDLDKTAHAPLAAEMFQVPGVKGVYIGSGFVTITSESPAEMDAIQAVIIKVLEEYLNSGKPVVTDGIQKEELHTRFTSEIEIEIINILENEIRPAVAMDGGDITFAGFEDGVVRLHLRGACSSCPSSIFTLKLGIENRLKQAFPEVDSVEAI